jgi:hypothetical protein
MTKNLKLISDPPAERRRVARLNVTTEQFRLTKTGKIFSVADLSIEGMALRMLDPQDLIHFALGDMIEGTLNLRREKHLVRARVRRMTADRVGLQFEDLESSSREALLLFFDPAVLGSELRPVPSNEEGTIWYHGPSGTDLMLRRKVDGQFERLLLVLMGSYVQWEEGLGVATGSVSSSNERGQIEGVVRLETLVFAPDSHPDRGKLEIAKTLILSSNLPQDLKKWCARQLLPSATA